MSFITQNVPNSISVVAPMYQTPLGGELIVLPRHLSWIYGVYF